MAKNVNHVSLIKSTNTAITSGDSVFIASGQTGPKLPTPDVLIQGEIAVNLAKGVETLSIKNTDNEIVTFSSDKIIKKVIVDNERITAAALNDLEVNKQDVLTPGSGISIVNNVISSTVEDITVDDALSSTSENPVQNKVINNALSNKVNNATYAAYTANTASILSGKQDTMSAGTNISIDDNVISTTFDIDTELSSSSTNPVANSAITKVIEENELITAAALNDLEEKKLDASAYTPTDLSDLYILSGKVDDNAFVAAAALNDLNNRLYDKLDASAYTPTDLSDYYDKDDVDTLVANRVSSVTINNVTKASTNGNVNLGPVVSSMTVNGSAVTVTNGAAALTGIAAASDLLKYADKAEYSSNDKKIYFKNGNTTLTSMTIDATAFIKDGMVNDVDVSGVTSGGSVVDCLVITFNTDAGKENINIPLSEIFDSNLYYTKTEIDNKLGSGFTGENSGNTVTKVIEDNELAISAALNDLNNRKLDASAYTPTDLSDLYVLSGVVNESSIVTAAALNDLNERLYDKLDASAYTQVEVDFELNSGSTNPVANSAITTTILENEEVVSEALADLDSRISGNTTYINQVNAKADTIARSLSGYTPSGYSYSKGEVEVKLADKLDASAYTPTDLSGYYTKQEIDEDKLGSGFTGDNSGVTVTQAINETETVVAAALNDLNDRIDSLDGDIDALESAIQNIDLPTIDGDSDLWSIGSTGVPATSALTEVLEEIEEVTATALNDLNDKIAEVSGNQLTADSFKTINNESIIGSGNIEIQGGGSDANALSGVSVNGTAASVSNKVANITSVPADIVATSSTRTFVTTTEKSTWNAVTAKTDTTAFTAHTGDTTVHVTSAEKTQWNNAITGVSVNGSAVTVTDKVAAISGVSLEPLVIEVTFEGENPVMLPNGTYASITAALAVGKEVVLKCLMDSADGEIKYFNLYEDRESVGDGMYSFSTVFDWISYRVVIENTDELTLASVQLVDAERPQVITAQKEFTVSPIIPTAALSSNDTTAASTAFVKAALNNQTHGNITSSGTLQTTDVAIANGDKLVITDSSDSSKIARASLSFDGSTTTKALTQKGTWETFVTSETTLSTASTGTGSVVTGLTVSNHQITMQKGNVTLDNVADGTTRKLSDYATTGSVNTLSGTVTAHTANTTVHVTPSDKSTWSGKQDALSNASVLTGITSAKVTQWDNAISGVSLNGSAATVTNHVAALTGVATTTNVSTHSGTTIPSATSSQMHLPAVTAADNGKILMVVNGAWALVNPTTIYTGTGTPSSGQGNDGDIYLQTS